MTYDFGGLIEWSKRQDDNHGRGLFVVHDKKQIRDITQEEWFQELLAAKHVKGRQGQIGRDNLLFTLALACYSVGKDETVTYNFLDELNSSLQAPLKHSEVRKIIKSAYKGRFKGAHSSYIQQLLEEWGSGRKITIQSNPKNWYKFKKARKDRKRSHYDEWEVDILAFINQKSSISSPITWATQKQICEEIGIARSTFNEVIKQSSKIMVKRVGKGCKAQTGLTSVAVLLKCALAFNQTHRLAYYAALKILMKEPENAIPIQSFEETLTSVYRTTRPRVDSLFKVNSS